MKSIIEWVTMFFVANVPEMNHSMKEMVIRTDVAKWATINMLQKVRL
jgi:hypothetical protein